MNNNAPALIVSTTFRYTIQFASQNPRLPVWFHHTNSLKRAYSWYDYRDRIERQHLSERDLGYTQWVLAIFDHGSGHFRPKTNLLWDRSHLKFCYEIQYPESTIIKRITSQEMLRFYSKRG